MSVTTVAKPLNKIKKIRSLDEILTRGGQAISVYREQRRGGQSVPSDGKFNSLIDADQFGDVPIVAETLWQKFYKNADEKFFPTFRDPEESVEAFRSTFGADTAEYFISSANAIVDGRIELLGLGAVYFGKDIDWHREPLSAKRSPLKHWKEFDELDSTETGNKKVIWELNRHQHFFTLGVAYWLTGDERFGETFARHLASWMEQNPPGMGINWASSLEVSFRAMSWIWAFHFFRDSEHLTPSLFRDALKHLYHHARHIELYLSKYYSPNTHLTGEGLGLYYIGTQLPFFERSTYWRKLGDDILMAEIGKQVFDDGVYFEQSTWYQRYTADFYSHFVVLRALSGEPYFDEHAAKLEERLECAFELLKNFTFPNGRTPIIGDDDGGRMLPLTDAASDDFRGSLAAGAVIFGAQSCKRIAGEASQELFWLTGAEGVRAFDALPTSEPVETSRRFENGGYCVMRDGWSDTDNCLVVDCGEIGSLAGGHGHADALAIEVAMHGKTMLVDSGTYTYHDSRELRDYFRSTTAHNTLTIDGLSSSDPGGIFNWNTKANAKCDAWIAEDPFDLFEGSHDGYQRLSDPATHRRSIIFVKGDYWIMRDMVETAGEHECALNFHFDHGIKTEIGGEGAWGGGDNHRMFAFGDNAAWERKESWISKNHGNRVNAPFLRFSSKGEGPQEFFTFLMPFTRSSEPARVSEVSMTLGRAFVIEYEGYRDLFVFNDDTSNLIDNGIFESNFRYTWARLSEDALPDEFVLIDGNSLKIDGSEVFDSHELTYASIRRLGGELYTKTDLGRSIRSLS